MAGPALELVPEGTGENRVPPNDIAAEKSTLGGMLLSKDIIGEVSELVKGGDFYLPKHEIIFDAIITLFAKGDPADTISLSDQLTKQGDLQKVGGAAYLHELASFVPTAANATYYASIVADKAILRGLVTTGTRITQMGFAAEGEPIDLVNEAQAEVFSIGRAARADDAVTVSDALVSAIDEMEAIAGRNGAHIEIPTGFRELDTLTNGLHPGQLVLIAARPALGKSTLALDFARSAAIKANKPTVFFSLEMSRAEIAMRLLSAETSIFLHKMRNGTIDSQGWKKISQKQADLANAPLYIDDSPNLTLVEIRAKCRRMKQQHGLGLVVIDYLQLMSSGKRVESRQQEVSEFSRSLKLLAKELGVPVIALSQLNRGPEQRTDKKPQLSDLRESGSLEQDADIVILLHRERYAENNNEKNDAELIVAKHRNGATATLTVLFEGAFSRFSDMAPDTVGI